MSYVRYKSHINKGTHIMLREVHVKPEVLSYERYKELEKTDKAQLTKIVTALYPRFDQEVILRGLLKTWHYAKLFDAKFKSICEIMKQELDSPSRREKIQREYDVMNNCIHKVNIIHAYLVYVGMGEDGCCLPRCIYKAAEDPSKSCIWLESVYELYKLYIARSLSSMIEEMKCNFEKPYYGFSERDAEYVCFVPPINPLHFPDELHYLIDEVNLENIAFIDDETPCPTIDRQFYLEQMFFPERA